MLGLIAAAGLAACGGKRRDQTSPPPGESVPQPSSSSPIPSGVPVDAPADDAATWDEPDPSSMNVPRGPDIAQAAPIDGGVGGARDAGTGGGARDAGTGGGVRDAGIGGAGDAGTGLRDAGTGGGARDAGTGGGARGDAGLPPGSRPGSP